MNHVVDELGRKKYKGGLGCIFSGEDAEDGIDDE
jgi:hypothetical protein